MLPFRPFAPAPLDTTLQGRLTLPGGAEVFASITRDATHELGIKEGGPATAVIKASSVIIGVRD